MINKFLTDIKIIKNAIDTKKLVVFAGAGISVDAGVPLWSKLIDEIKEELDLPKYENDYLKIPQIYYNERQEKEYVEKIRKILKHKKLKHNEIHEEIFELNPEHILTTNFEDLLEQVIYKKSLPFSVVKEDVDLPYSSNTKLLVKVHGDLDNKNFVLKEDDYLNYSKNHPLIEAFINSVFASKIVLFIGYSFSDYNLKQIVQNVRNILGNNFQNAYLLSIDDELHLSHKKYLKNQGINVIDYFDANYINASGNKESYIESFLKGNNIYKQAFLREYKHLSIKGQLLLNLIKFIRFYDELKTSVTKEDVLDQIHKSISRFSELKSLPQFFIAGLYPFKTSHKYEHLIEGTTLLLKNKIVKELFYKNLSIEKNTVKYKSDNDLPENELNNKSEKLKEIIIKLNNSLIFYATKENTKSDSFGYKGFSKDIIDLNLNSEQYCTCSICKYEDFKLNEVLMDLNSYSINETSGLKEDLQKAYLNYKFGNFILSFKMHEEIATKAWQTGKYITYYISKTNMKSLKGLIDHNEINVNSDEKNKVIRKIEDIDSDKLIFQVPYTGNEEYDLLKIIRDDTVFTKSKDKIEDLYLKAEKIYNSYKNPHYFSHGPYYPQLIYIELFKIITFYTKNYIINDIFSNFRKVIQKGLEALVLLHVTNKRYEGKLPELSNNFFILFVSYNDFKSFNSFLNKYKIKLDDLIFDEKDINKIINYCLNYFKSFYTKNRLFLNNSHKNDLVFSQLNKQSFESNIISIYKNMITLLLCIDIPNKRGEEFVETLIKFLEHENFLYGEGIKYLNWLIEKNGKYISKEQCKSLLDIVQKNKKKYEMFNTVDSLAYLMVENNIPPLNDRDYVFKFVEDYNYYNTRGGIFTYMWKISDEQIKKELEEKLVKELTNNFNEENYLIASYEDMIDFNIFFEEFLKNYNSFFNNNNEEIYDLVDGKPIIKNTSVSTLVYFIYQIGIKSTDERLKILKHLPDSMKFFVLREKSDLSKFKIEWLYLFKRDFILNELSKIKKLKTILKNDLKANYSEELSKIYTKYFM